ncbi:unnamed protein product [Caenorhabditis auriculariae]|uniref:Serine/threonine-protein phosphatase n=1 Tax=Caenorhabditis auriculariae TaxID=2777116 RepID=A0A8S1HM73_9PELO|nr:unnamed protein product [Caenorhabditis auriculariae]
MSQQNSAEKTAEAIPKIDARLAEWMDDLIKRLNSLYKNEQQNITHVMTGNEVIAVIQMAQNVFMEESNLCEAEAPIKVIGDIHAQFQDMNRLFDIIGRVPEERFMFLGDYIDRGPQGIEVLMLLFALKIRYRNRIYLLRGNHETPAVNKIYGFYNECALKYGVGIWWDFQACFNRIPMAGLISKKVLCMHGGLSPELTHLDVIRNIPRPCEPLDRGLLIDLLWSDPTNKGEGWFHSIRGISYMFGRGVVEQASKLLGIDLIIRAHQVVQDGYEMMTGRRLITVFSVPNYCQQFTNAAAVVCLNSNLEISFQQMAPPPLPATVVAKPAPAIAIDTDSNAAKADKEFIKPFDPKLHHVDLKRRADSESSDQSIEDREPVKKSKSTNKAGGARITNEEGDEMIELGSMRYLTVRSFRGKPLIDIREFYVDKASGKMKPGKKGISLSREQFENFKALIPEIDEKLTSV